VWHRSHDSLRTGRRVVGQFGAYWSAPRET
jgi:hypothetical protein